MHIITVPPEIFLHIASHLPHNDLIKLLRVCKSIQTLVEPLLWREIELHRQHFHEDLNLAIDKCKPRPYRLGMVDETVRECSSILDQNCAEAAKAFLKKFDSITKASHLECLAKHVRWLCLEIKPYQHVHAEGIQRSCWNTFTKFPNLEYLEIHAQWREFESVVFDSSAAPLENLHTVKLKGFIPKELIEYLLQRPSSIKQLELAVLDDPVGDTLGTTRANPHKRELVGSDSYDVFAPRPLICIPKRCMLHFENLTHLWLCKPTDGYDDTHERFATYEIWYSEESDKGSFEEWAKLLTATRDTLTHLTLEHRPATENIETGATGNEEYMRMGRNKVLREGRSYQQFCSIVLPVLLESEGWSSLKTITLFGIDDVPPGCVKCEDRWQYNWCDGARPSCSVCLQDGLECTLLEPRADSIKAQLEARFPNVSVSSLLGRRMLFDANTGLPSCGYGVLGDEVAVDDDGEVIWAVEE